MKKTHLISLIFLFTLVSCGGFSSSDNSSFEESESKVSNDIDESEVSEMLAKQSKLRYSNLPVGVNEYTHIELFVGEEKIPLIATKINYSQSWNGLAPNRYDAGVAVIELEGRATLSMKTRNFLFNQKSVIRPLAAGIEGKINEERDTFTFVIDSPGNYVIEPNGERIVAVHLFVRALSDDTNYKNDSNVLYFGPGLHDASNDARLATSIVNLKSNQTVYLAFGAIVRARFVAANQSNIKIVGNGVIDGSTFMRIAGQASGNTAFVPLEFSWCSKVSFQDFILLDPAGWVVNWYFVKNSEIDNIAMITSRSNGDGISLQSCEDIEVRNSFVRSWDDALVVKNYPDWRNKNIEGITRNIRFSNMVLWIDLAQAMEIGYETVGEVMENIIFEDITILRALHKPVISIHNANNARVKDVIYRNITVESALMGRGDGNLNNELIDIVNIYSNSWSTNHKITPMGNIDGVLVENVLVLSGNDNIPIRVAGAYDERSEYLSEHWVNNIKIKDVEIKGEILTNDYPYFNVGAFTNNVFIEATGKIITGANYIRLVPKAISDHYDVIPITSKS